jgi:Polymer-forming cytoskeletal/Aminoacyl-tRNA editing domain
MNKDVMRPAGETAGRAPSRLGSSLHVKGEISGNEDIDIDGAVEGLVQIDERKLTVGATAKLPADIIAGEVIVYGSVKGNVRGKGLATEQEFSSLFPDCELGAMPPFGSLYNLPVYVDESLAADEAIVFNAGTHRDAIRMRFDDFVRLAKPRVCSFAQQG